MNALKKCGKKKSMVIKEGVNNAVKMIGRKDEERVRVEKEVYRDARKEGEN